MSTLSATDIQRIAELSKLHISNEQLTPLTHQLENILNLVKKMDDAKTQNVVPLAHPFNATQPLRADIISENDQRDLFQQNAPHVEAGLYIVPKYMESE